MYKNIKSSSSIVGCSAPHRTTTTTGTVARRGAFRNSLKQLRYWQIFSTFFGPFSSARSIDLVLIQPLSFECCFFLCSPSYILLGHARAAYGKFNVLRGHFRASGANYRYIENGKVSVILSICCRNLGKLFLLIATREKVLCY